MFDTAHAERTRVSIVEFLSELGISRVTVLCPGAAGLVRDPAHIGKIRGALGEALRESASPAVRAGLPCTFSPPCAYAELWFPEGEIRPGKPMPSPYVIEADTEGDGLRVTIKLVGRAGDYLGEVGDALIRGLRRGLSGKRWIRLEPEARTYSETIGLADPGLTAQVSLRFLTPLLVRNSENGPHIEPGAVLRGMIHRADGMARHCGIELDADFPALLEATKAVEGVWTDVDVRDWTRGAVRQRRLVPMEGALGRLHLRGDLAPFSPFIALAEELHTGSRVQFGQGRFRIEQGV
ncbi:CRISPR system precrRNA processing endoribonuclease RAMP protein Cas6 [Rhodovulum sp. YEN HP10]|uniref:CRISPR system precrRNA processing endoribonuclease RAMP protein Cas6 n=1 Tax=Rhodovulum sp. HP10 TaxID=3387397 RepID=UPI0039DF333C